MVAGDFKEIHKGFMEFKVYLHPVNENAAYFHFEIPGEACDMLRWEYYFGLINYLQCNFPDKYSFKRVDLAFDQVPFTPQDVEEAIKAGLVRSLAKRESLVCLNAHFQLRDDGVEGCSTVQFGSRASERMIRVYNKRGFTRLELQTRDDRADAICKGLFVVQDTSCWFPLLIGHLRDFVDLDTPWWVHFISGYSRAYLTLFQNRGWRN